jgi:small neutral amino acid transporter SnatA (MarC family)
MNDFIIAGGLLVFVIAVACFVNKFLPPEYYQRVEDKYNDVNNI